MGLTIIWDVSFSVACFCNQNCSCHCFFTCRLTVRVFQKKWLLGNTGSMKSPSSCTSLEKKSWNSDNYSCECLNLILINKHMSSCLTHVIFTSMLSCHFSTLRRKVSPKKFLQKDLLGVFQAENQKRKNRSRKENIFLLFSCALSKHSSDERNGSLINMMIEF